MGKVPLPAHLPGPGPLPRAEQSQLCLVYVFRRSLCPQPHMFLHGYVCTRVSVCLQYSIISCRDTRVRASCSSLLTDLGDCWASAQTPLFFLSDWVPVVGMWVPSCVHAAFPRRHRARPDSKHSCVERGSLLGCGTSLGSGQRASAGKSPERQAGCPGGTRPVSAEGCHFTAFQRGCPAPTPTCHVSGQRPALLLPPPHCVPCAQARKASYQELTLFRQQRRLQA